MFLKQFTGEVGAYMAVEYIKGSLVKKQKKWVFDDNLGIISP